MRALAAALATAALAVFLVMATPAAGRSHNVDCDCWDVSVIDADGGRTRLLLENQGVLGWNIYDLSPDRRTLLFSHGPLYRASITGGGMTRVARGAGSARWSPDGRFMSYSTEGQPCASGVSAALVVANANGGARRHVGDCAYGGSWSPASSRLAFARLLPSKSVLTVADRDGRHPHNLATAASQIEGVEWAPRGGWIAYMVGMSLHVVRADGREDDFVARVNTLRWSPNGRRLLVMLRNRESRSALYAMNRDGRRRVRLAWYAINAAWAPDGRRVAYAGCHIVSNTRCLSRPVRRRGERAPPARARPRRRERRARPDLLVAWRQPDHLHARRPVRRVTALPLPEPGP
jgi:Tol biopolymer transport system component